MGNPGEEVQVADADVAGNLDLLVLVDGERDHAVHVAGPQPGSSIAAFTASQANCISLRPDSFENSVWPIPTMAAFPAMPSLLMHRPRRAG